MERKSEPTRYERQARERIISLINEYCGGSQQQLSEKTGIGKASISQYVNGKNVPSNITAKKLCAPFKINPAWIMGFDVPKTIIPDNQNDQAEEDRNALLQKIYDENKILFDAAEDATPEEIIKAAGYLEGLKAQR